MWLSFILLSIALPGWKIPYWYLVNENLTFNHIFDNNHVTFLVWANFYNAEKAFLNQMVCIPSIKVDFCVFIWLLIDLMLSAQILHIVIKHIRLIIIFCIFPWSRAAYNVVWQCVGSEVKSWINLLPKHSHVCTIHKSAAFFKCLYQTSCFTQNAHVICYLNDKCRKRHDALDMA